VTIVAEKTVPAKHASTHGERIAALEERTSPKPKTIVDRIKDWGGVASLVIAIGYSFPLGIWEKFIEPENRRIASELQNLRNVIEQTTTIFSEGARTLSSIQDPNLYDTAGRSINMRIYLLMSKHRRDFEKHRDKLNPPELLIVGSNFYITGRSDAALPFIEAALAKADLDIQSRIEAMRQRAKILFSPGPLQNHKESRKSFKDAIAAMESVPNMRITSMSLLSEWALFELVDGDWSCGQEKLAEAKSALKELSPYMYDNGNFARMLAQRTESLSIRNGQTNAGC
jgi:hypothetical protein